MEHLNFTNRTFCNILSFYC